MPDGIPLRIVDRQAVEEFKPGMMWRVPEEDEGDRECWWIVLPNTKPDSAGHAQEIAWLTTSRGSRPPHDMWDVTGTAPNITVNPSIDVECWVYKDGEPVRDGSYWHGWIKDGIIL